VGVIPAYTRSFCGTCNRLRITAKGTLKTCLYSADGFSLKEALSLHDDQAIAEIIRREVSHKAVDGLAASSRTISTSMAEIGG
jgi:cyclic pyranopterin phosphate synthase